jgi:hypothetical protein
MTAITLQRQSGRLSSLGSLCFRSAGSRRLYKAVERTYVQPTVRVDGLSARGETVALGCK